MTIRITHVHFAEGAGKTLQSIARFRSVEDGTGNVYDKDKPTMVDWLDNKNISAYVSAGGSRVDVTVVHDNPPYLRTKPDATLKDNLLSLPTY